MVTFWDTSAIVPLLVRESGSEVAVARLRDEGGLVAWWGSETECRSAIARRRRDGTVTHSAAEAALVRLEMLSKTWLEVSPTDELRMLAGELLARHPLRAADALQLAAALRWCEGDTSGRRFATADVRLAEAARAEGFALSVAI